MEGCKIQTNTFVQKYLKDEGNEWDRKGGGGGRDDARRRMIYMKSQAMHVTLYSFKPSVSVIFVRHQENKSKNEKNKGSLFSLLLVFFPSPFHLQRFVAKFDMNT